MFSKSFRGPLRFILWPFLLVYWLGIGIRNWLYDKNILKSSTFGLPLICVGNLAVGGTGKSPMVEYLVEKLRMRYRVATLSRGYKRKTRGYALAGSDTTALEIGDEPMQFHLKFPDVPVAVGESRLEAIPQLLHDRPDTQVILLDDAFQHRSIRAGLNILLTEKERLFTRDHFLPVGNLRDQKKSYKRAQLIIVTKCDATLSLQEKMSITKELKPLKDQQVYFTSLQYGKISHIVNRDEWREDKETSVLLVIGIANPEPLQRYISSWARETEMMHYPDHHIYTIDDLRNIRERFGKIPSPRKIIITTEKDSVRLDKFSTELKTLPVYTLPVRHSFLFGEEGKFLEEVVGFVEQTRRD